MLVRAIKGLELKEIPEITRNRWRIAPFTEVEANSWLERAGGDARWKDSVREFFGRRLLGRICLFIETTGDSSQAKINAERRGRYLVNTLRYAIVAHLAPHGVAHGYGIELNVDARHPDAFSFDEFGDVTLFPGGAQRAPCTLTAEHFEIAKKDRHLEDLWAIVEEDRISDVELA